MFHLCILKGILTFEINIHIIMCIYEYLNLLNFSVCSVNKLPLL